jgi:hypothetical protein
MCACESKQLMLCSSLAEIFFFYFLPTEIIIEIFNKPMRFIPKSVAKTAFCVHFITNAKCGSLVHFMKQNLH